MLASVTSVASVPVQNATVRLIPFQVPGHELEETVWTRVGIASIEIDGRLERRIEPRDKIRFDRLIR